MRFLLVCLIYLCYVGEWGCRGAARALDTLKENGYEISNKDHLNVHFWLAIITIPLLGNSKTNRLRTFSLHKHIFLNRKWVDHSNAELQSIHKSSDNVILYLIHILYQRKKNVITSEVNEIQKNKINVLYFYQMKNEKWWYERKKGN